MAEPQLSVRSARAKEKAHRLALREKRTVAEIVERALEVYESQQAKREPASSFYDRISAEYGTDVDLEEIINEHRKPHTGIEL